MAEDACSEPSKFSLVTSTDPLRQKLWRAQQHGKFSDFQIKVNNVPIACHKVILAEQSEYFSSMFQHESCLEVSQSFVDLTLLNTDAVQLVIGFIYSGAIEVEDDMIKDVIKVMNYFQLTENDLEEKISEYIITNLCPENCLGWFEWFGDQVNLEKVELEARSVMLERFNDVSKSSEFMGLTFIQLTDYMRKLVQRYKRHDQALQAIVRWVMHNATKRGQRFLESLYIVDLNQCCSSAALKDIYEKHGNVLLKNSDLLAQFNASMLCAASKPSNDVIVIGGIYDAKHKIANRSTYVLNLDSGSIVEKASQTKYQLSTASCGFRDGVIFAYACPTDSAKNAPVDSVLYNKNTDTWETLPPPPAPICNAGVTCVQEVLLMAVGGIETRKNKVDCLDLRTMKWTTCRDMPQGVKLPIVGSIGTCMFVIFSTFMGNKQEQRGAEISVQCYDTTTNSWTFKCPLPEGIKNTTGTTAVTMAGLLYLIGGRHVCARYDPVGNYWTILSPPGGFHALGAALVVNSKIILTGGLNDCNNAQDIIEEYDPATNTCRLLPVKQPTPLLMHSMILG